MNENIINIAVNNTTQYIGDFGFILIDKLSILMTFVIFFVILSIFINFMFIGIYNPNKGRLDILKFIALIIPGIIVFMILFDINIFNLIFGIINIILIISLFGFLFNFIKYCFNHQYQTKRMKNIIIDYIKTFLNKNYLSLLCLLYIIPLILFIISQNIRQQNYENASYVIYMIISLILFIIITILIIISYIIKKTKTKKVK
jgi:hypothetical protein